MNNTFNLQRLGLLIKRQWLEFGKIFLITVGVALGVIVTFYTFSLWDSLFGEKQLWNSNNIDLNFREPLFFIFGFLFITVISSSYFSHLGQKPKAVIDLMIPASTFEKFLTGVLFTTILSSLAFLLVFYLTDLAFVSKLRSLYPNARWTSSEVTDPVAVWIDSIRYFFVQHQLKEFKSLAVIVPFFITSIFLLGSIYFNRFHYIKTAVSIIIFSGVWFFIIYNSGRLLFEGKVSTNQSSNMEIDNPKVWAEIGMFCLILVLTAIIWRITYVRLKEKQV
ncbi:MAG: hypothetical protein EOP00_30910 [Pedobacter sp.]|nr:MAG: hypothetical protein EOP00_30910 [Pedobacter sp.]